MDCKGISYLKSMLEKAMEEVRKDGATPQIQVADSESCSKYDSAADAARLATEIDDELRYRVYGKEWTLRDRGETFVFFVIYDPPNGEYDDETAPEIIYDCNSPASDLMDNVESGL